VLDDLLRVEQVSLRRGGRDLLRGVDLRLRPGEIHGLVGPNGCGKSSVAYTLMGCEGYAPDEGRIWFAGREITHLGITERARLGLTLAWQEPARFEGLSVYAYLALGMQQRSEERLRRALATLALAPDAYLGRTVDRALSGGERKRIELAAVFVMRPRLAILDEPDSGIDVLSLDDIGTLIRLMVSEGGAVLLITHRDELLAVADSASLLADGRIVYEGDPAQVRERYGCLHGRSEGAAAAASREQASPQPEGEG
jgi:Fe-S cluster assembly ATP-binding protein